MEKKPSTKTPRTLGPIADLEKHLPPEWWRSLFNAVYLKTDGDVVEDQSLTRAEVDRIIELTGIGKADRVLDLCCGQGRHLMELARRGFTQLTGVDRSRYLIRLARRRAKAEGKEISFREGDARKFRIGSETVFDCVTMLGNSFGYFDRSEDDITVLNSARRCLRAGGVLMLDLADGSWLREHFEPRSWEWLDQSQFVCRERTLSSDGTRLISREVVVDAERGVIADQFYAERLFSQEQILDALDRAGFKSARCHGLVETRSERDQDLGMMQRRMLLTATAPRSEQRPKRSVVPYPDVTVILGDPALPDSVKRGGQYNPEDLETVARLKSTLEGLQQYRFSFIDNHAALMRRLEQERPSFVLNLCDEGFQNHATLELHVPAFLEMLSIPYSGAGPSCLGLCYNKSLVASIAQSVDVPTPLETYVAPDDVSATFPAIFPALIKPGCGDGSIGITAGSVVSSPSEAIAYLNRLHTELPGKPILVQEYLSGTEYSVGVIGNPGLGYNVLPILEVDYSQLPSDLPKILSYESKWLPDSPYWDKIGYHEATIDEPLTRNLIDYATRLFERLECRDYARFDFRADAHGQVKLLEVNPNPGWCWDGKLNKMAEFRAQTYGSLLEMILSAAQQRVVSGNGRPANKRASNG